MGLTQHKTYDSIPKKLQVFLKHWMSVNKLLKDTAEEDIPNKPPLVYQYSTYDECFEATEKDSGQVQIVDDPETGKVYAAGLCFGRRMTREAVENPTEDIQEEEWRTVLHFASMTTYEYKEWRKNWNKDKKAWVEKEVKKKEQRAKLAESRKKFRQAFKKVYGDS